MVNYLTAHQILFLHARIIDETGGSHGVLDLALLESAVARPQSTFDRQDLYPGLFAKVAALMHSLICGHPFVDGNKRTGIAAAGLFVERNGYRVAASNEELEGFARRVACGDIEVGEIAAWLEGRSEPTE